MIWQYWVFVIVSAIVALFVDGMYKWLGLDRKTALTFSILLIVLVVIGLRPVDAWAHVVENFNADDALGNERLPSELTNKLKLYISVLGKNSYTEGKLLWQDISGDRDQEHTSKCSGNRDFTMSEYPMVEDIKTGLGTRNVVFTGPRSEDLGLVGSGDFTFYWYSKNSTELTATPVHVFALYSNTPSNIAIQVSLKQEGSQSIMVIDNSLDGASLSTVEVGLNGSFSPSSGACSFALVRSSGTLQVFFNDAPQGSPIPCGKERVLLSNRRININPTGTWDAKLSVFAVYRRALSTSEVSGVTAYIRKRLVVLDDEYRDLMQQKNELESKKKCPIDDPNVCNICSGITDWSNPTNFLQNASMECKEAINQYCKNNPSVEFCACWGKDKDKTSCNVMRSFFDQSATSVVKECDVRKLYPESSEPSLMKYYVATSPLQMAASMMDIPIPDDMIVNWTDDLPLIGNQLSSLTTDDNNIPNDRVVKYFNKLV